MYGILESASATLSPYFFFHLSNSLDPLSSQPAGDLTLKEIRWQSNFIHHFKYHWPDDLIYF